MRFFSLAIVLLAVPAVSVETKYPLWDGEESIEQYAKKVGLPPTKTIDLGDGVTMEFVLIPAGTFVMGTDYPPELEEEPYLTQIRIGLWFVWISFALLATLFVAMVIQARLSRRRLQMSLAMLVGLAIFAGIGLLGAMHWQHSTSSFDQAKAEYMAARRDFGHSEAPAHQVTLTRPFWLGKYEVTQAQYQTVMGVNPSRFKSGPNWPVDGVLWAEANAFCEKAGAQVRLPTEAEWEYACRGGTTTKYHSGDDDAGLAAMAWFEANSDDRTHPVGLKGTNAWGLHDVHGNVCEWCEDWELSYLPRARKDPRPPVRGHHRILRGGSYNYRAGLCRSAWRGSDAAALKPVVGFRVVLDLEP